MRWFKLMKENENKKLNVTWKYLENYCEDSLNIVNKELCGVYLICHVNDNLLGNHKVVYVGQGNIYDNLYRHLTNEQNEYLKKFLKECNSCVYYADTGEKNAQGVEAYLLQRLEPACNKNSSQFEPIEINLPAVYDPQTMQ